MAYQRTFSIDVRARKLADGGHSAYLTIPLRNNQSIGFGVNISAGVMPAMRDFLCDALRACHDMLHLELQKHAMLSQLPAQSMTTAVVDTAPVEGYFLRRSRDRGEVVGGYDPSSSATGDYVGASPGMMGRYIHQTLHNSSMIQRAGLRALGMAGKSRFAAVGCCDVGGLNDTGFYVGGYGDYVGDLGQTLGQVLGAVAPAVAPLLGGGVAQVAAGQQAAGGGGGGSLGQAIGSALGGLIPGVGPVLGPVLGMLGSAIGNAVSPGGGAPAQQQPVGPAGPQNLVSSPVAMVPGGVAMPSGPRPGLPPGGMGAIGTGAGAGFSNAGFTSVATPVTDDGSAFRAAVLAAGPSHPQYQAVLNPVQSVPPMTATAAGMMTGNLPASYLAGGEVLAQALNALNSTPSLRAQVDPAIMRTISNALRAMETSAAARLGSNQAKQILREARNQTANELTRALDLVNLIIAP